MAKETKEVKDIKEKTIERKAQAEKQLDELVKSRDEEDAALKAYVDDANKHIGEKQQLIGQMNATILSLRAAVDTMASLLEE